MRKLAQETDKAHEDTRRAESALQRVVFTKLLLQHMELLSAREPFDRFDLRVVRLPLQIAGTSAPLAVHDDRAGAADSVLAPDVRPGQARSSRRKSTSSFLGSVSRT
jgi:hypothetical protein